MALVLLGGCVRGEPAADDTDAPAETDLPAVDGDDDGSPEGVDCDDADPTRSPALPEVCGDGVDQDCDPRSECPDLCDTTVVLPPGACDAVRWPAAGLSLYWTLDDAATGLTDRSPTGDDAVVDGVVGFEPGVLGGAAVFSGAGAVRSDLARGAGAWTVAGWLRADALPDSVEVHILLEIGNRREPASGFVVMQFETGDLGVRMSVGDGGPDTFIGLAPGGALGCWHHLVFRHDAGAVTAWVDGEVVIDESLPAPILLGPGGLWLGGSPTSAGHAVTGRVDEVGWWDVAVSDAEARALFYAASCGARPTD
jgi:hypothetical protein